MSLKDDVIRILGAVPLGTNKESSVRQHTTRLDYTGTKQHPQIGYTLSKIIQSGKMFESYDFEFPVRFGVKGKTSSKVNRKKSERSEEHRTRTIVRAINNIRRLTHLNFTENDKFITLTFNNEQEFDINQLDKCLPFYQKFIRRLRTKYPKLKFITVPEFQKRGAVHYHLLCNIPKIRQLEMQKLWSYGFFKVKEIHGTTHLSFYLVKYLSKKFEDKRKQGHRLYYTSRGLLKPKTLYGRSAEALSKKLKMDHSNTLQYENSYDTEHNGETIYKQYVIKK